MRRIIWFVLSILYFLPSQAQTKMSTILYNYSVVCPKPTKQGAGLEDVRVTFFVDGKRASPTGDVFSQGGHYLRANVEPREGYSGNFIITRIEWFKCGAGVYGEPKNEISQTFNSKEATMLVNIENAGDKNPCYRAWIYIDKCEGKEQKPEKTKVKVIATAAEKGYKQEYKVTDKIKTVLAGYTLNFDQDGVAFIEVPAKKHVLKIDWDGGGISSEEKVSIRSFSNNKPVNIDRIPNRFSFIDEYNLDLEPFAGTENLYDCEIHISLVYEPPRNGVNEVRIVAVQPSVEVHKAGTPEDAWIPATRDMVLQGGDEISCDPEGAATLQFADMSTTVVRNTTQLKIASYFTEGGVVKTEILLKMGEVAAQIHKSEATKSDFKIKTPGDGGSVRGTKFSYRYDPNSRSSIIKVEEGLVEISSNTSAYSPLMLKAGQQVTTYPSSIGKPEPFSEKIDFNLPRKNDQPSINIKDPLTDISGNWEITQGSYTGTLTLTQQGDKIVGRVIWSNHQKGNIEGDFLYGFITFVATYDGDLIGYYNGRLDETGKKMIEGKGLSNKGTESTWSATRK